MKLFIFFTFLVFAFHSEASDKPRDIGNGLCEVLLKDGVNVWGWYKCDACSQDTLADPKFDGQSCDNCGVGHTKEEYQKPRTRSEGGRLILIVPTKSLHRVVAAPKSESDRIADSKEKWGCTGCGHDNFQTDPECKTCKRPKTKGTNTRFALGEYTPDNDVTSKPGTSIVQTQYSDAKPAASEYKYGAPVIDGSLPAPSPELVTKTVTEAADRAEIEDRETTIPPRPTPSFKSEINQLTLQRLKLVGAAVVVVAATYIATQTYLWTQVSYAHNGTITQQGEVYKVNYKDSKGRLHSGQLKLLDGESSSITPVRAEGEKVKLHFTNGRGLVGVERLTGDVLVPVK